jgi:hypothetical protein
MPFVRFLASALMWTTVATPMFADVTLRMRMTETGAGGLDRVSDVTEYRKGLKVRTDMSGPQTTSGSMIMDLETGRSLMLWHAGKVADVFDLAQLRAAQPNEDADVKHSIVRTVESRQIAGETCTVHTFTALTRTIMRQESVAFRMEGSACLVPNGPGQPDFTSYARAAAKIGRGPDLMSELHHLGVPYFFEVTMSLGGSGPTDVLRPFTTQRMELTSISTAPIPDSVFEVPADYTARKK